jgi:hypothetical protein
MRADPLLASSVLSAPSEAEALVAFSLLREKLSEDELVQLANLRALLAELPATPFRTGESLEILERAGRYEYTGRSYRRVFDGAQGVFGVEFLGQVNTCEGIVVHTPTGRLTFGAGNVCSDESALRLLVEEAVVLDAVLEALATLGCPLDPPIYLSVDDFVGEHAGPAISAALCDLF